MHKGNRKYQRYKPTFYNLRITLILLRYLLYYGLALKTKQNADRNIQSRYHTLVFANSLLTSTRSAKGTSLRIPD